MKDHFETQAYVSGEGAYRSVAGCVRISPMGSGSLLQAHIKGLPGLSAFYGFCMELCGRRCPLPSLLSCCGEALMSVYVCSFTPEETAHGRVVLTAGSSCPDGCSRIACGPVLPIVRPERRPIDPRPLFGAPPRW